MIALVILLFACTASAIVEGSIITFAPFEQGQLGTIDNPLKPSEIVDVYITVNNYFFAMNVLVGIEEGNARIIDATGIEQAEEFGWFSDISNDPIITDRLVELGLAALYDPKPAGLAAKIRIQALTEGIVIIGIANGSGVNFEPSMDGYFRVDPVVKGELLVYQTHLPEPATILLLGLGILPAVIKRKK
jgi:hypothetical protein